MNADLRDQPERPGRSQLEDAATLRGRAPCPTPRGARARLRPRGLGRTGAVLVAAASAAHNLDGSPVTAYMPKGTNGVQLVVRFDADRTYLVGLTDFSSTRGR
ncbi:hypothetical protein [Amycolatopsis sp. NPDC051372]|uniref:hypothetical protein n=1 Tax=unclassified Amycolatopsis TaxID=2618356 RepID=UPI003415B0F9